MRRYVARRFVHMVVTLFAMMTIMFFMFRLLPGDPTMTVISSAMDPRAQETMRASSASTSRC